MHLCLYIYVYVQCVIDSLILKIKFDCKSRDSIVDIIALRIYSHARWVILFQVTVRLIRERHDSRRSPCYLVLVWYLTRDVYICFVVLYILYVMNHFCTCMEY
jgi:hypothetical protein